VGKIAWFGQSYTDPWLGASKPANGSVQARAVCGDLFKAGPGLFMDGSPSVP